MAGGAALYMTAPDEPGWPLLAALAGAPSILWLILRRRGAGLLPLAVAFLACIAIGALCGKIRATLVAAPILKEQMGPVRIEGVIAEIDASERSRRVRIDVRAIEGLSPEQTPRFVRFSFKGDLGLAPGRAAACRAILSPPPRPVAPGDYEFHRDAWFQQLGAVGFAIGDCRPLATPPPMSWSDQAFHWLGAVRRAMAEHVYRAAGGHGGAMSAAMVAGDRSFITPDDAEALRLSGLAHLLSISGVHMVLVGGIVFFIVRMGWPVIEPLALRAPAVRAAALAAIIACTLYFAVSGMEVATQRAYVIALIGFGAKLFDRPALSLRSLAIALAVIVILQPESVVTPGFQMSFAASGALIALYEIWPKLERPDRPGPFSRIGGWFIAAAATSFVASLATMPFALHHFDRAAIFSVLANIASTPIITLWTTPAAALAALAAPLGLDEPFLWLMGQSLDLVLAIAHWSVWLSPEIDLPRLGAFGMALAAAAIALFCILYRRGRVLAVIPAAASVWVWLSAPQAIGYVADDGSVFLKQPGNGWTEITDWRAANGLDPLIVGDRILKSPCPGKGGSCVFSADAGEATIATQLLQRPSLVPLQQSSSAPAALPDVPLAASTVSGAPRTTTPGTTAGGGFAADAASPAAACATAAQLILRPPSGSSRVITPCEFIGKGGAAITRDNVGRLDIEPAVRRLNRPWSQPLHAPVADRTPKPPTSGRRTQSGRLQSPGRSRGAAPQ